MKMCLPIVKKFKICKDLDFLDSLGIFHFFIFPIIWKMIVSAKYAN